MRTRPWHHETVASVAEFLYNGRMDMGRRSFVEGTLATAGVATMPGCAGKSGISAANRFAASVFTIVAYWRQ